MSMAAPPPIPGEAVDPPAKEKGKAVDTLHDMSSKAAVVARAVLRFSGAHGPLLAAGTSYYIFLSLFSLLALAFGLVALLGSAQMSEYLTSAMNQALPGLVGDQGIDAEQLKSLGRSTSLIGLLAFLYSGAGVMGAASSGLHILFGAPKDPRNVVVMKARLIGWLVVIAPLLVLSLTPSLLLAELGDPVLQAVGVGDNDGVGVVMVLASYVAAIALNFLIIYILFSRLGGIRPARGARAIGAILGAVVIELLRFVMTSVIAYAVDRPQYGAFAVPIAVLLVFYLQCLAFYFSAALAAAVALEGGGDAPDTMKTDTSSVADPFGEGTKKKTSRSVRSVQPRLVPPQASAPAKLKRGSRVHGS